MNAFLRLHGFVLKARAHYIQSIVHISTNTHIRCHCSTFLWDIITHLTNAVLCTCAIMQDLRKEAFFIILDELSVFPC